MCFLQVLEMAKGKKSNHRVRRTSPTPAGVHRPRLPADASHAMRAQRRTAAAAAKDAARRTLWRATVQHRYAMSCVQLSMAEQAVFLDQKKLWITHDHSMQCWGLTDAKQQYGGPAVWARQQNQHGAAKMASLGLGTHTTAAPQLPPNTFTSGMWISPNAWITTYNACSYPGATRTPRSMCSLHEGAWHTRL